MDIEEVERSGISRRIFSGLDLEKTQHRRFTQTADEAIKNEQYELAALIRMKSIKDRLMKRIALLIFGLY